MNNRQERLREALRETAAEFLAREANRDNLVTVTRAEVSDDSKHGEILITVFPDTAEAAAVQFANRHRAEFAEFFKKRIRGVFLPRIEFMIDKGEKNRQRLDELSE